MIGDHVPEPLEPLPEDWSRALAVVAHPDDLEYGAAAAVARWTAQGKEVTYLLATRGEAGIDDMAPELAAPLRESEQRASSAIAGVRDVEFLDWPDGMIEYGLPLRRDLAAAIRRHRPEMVVTLNFRETFGSDRLNQADHVAIGRALVDAVRDAGNRWVFRDLLDEGLPPWTGVRAVLAANSPRAAHGVDVSASLNRAVTALRAHETYLRGLGEETDPQEFLESMARPTGTRLGCRFGVAFEMLRVD